MQCSKRIQRGFSMSGVATCALALGGMTLALQAQAGCLDYKAAKKVSWRTTDDSYGPMRFIKVSQTDDGSQGDWSQGDWEPSVHRAPIVGLWEFKYISEGNKTTLGIPNGAIIDGGITLWFADGNENTVSGVRDPGTGDVCLGVWKRTGEHSYELNHVGLSWDDTKHVYAGPAFIKQKITLAEDHNHYSGTFTINQLDPDGKTGSLPALIKGTITATRINIDTDTFEALP